MSHRTSTVRSPLPGSTGRPVALVAGGVAGTVLVGAIAGVYPSLRAARLSPTEALASA